MQFSEKFGQIIGCHLGNPESLTGVDLFILHRDRHKHASYRPQRSWGKVMFFTRVCDSVHKGSLLVYHPHPPSPGPRSRLPPGSSACWEIRATSGWYASYWNVFLLFEFSQNVFIEFSEFSDKTICYYSKRTRTCHPATSCLRDQHATTVPARHMWETGSINLAQFML